MKKQAPNFLERRNADWLQGRSSVASGHVVLVADDSETDIFFLLRAFGTSKVKNPVYVVRSGQEVLDYLEGKGQFSDRRAFPLPKIVLLDLRMPVVDGYTILRWKQTRPELSRVLFVALSNFDSARSINLAYQSGATTFLSKPLQAADVDNLVRSYEEYWMVTNHPATPAQSNLPQVQS